MSSYLKALKYVGSDVLSPAFHDILRSAPDALFLGSSILGLLTQNFALGVFVLAMAEFGVTHRVLAGIIGSAQGNTRSPRPEICSAGIPSPYQISVIGKVLGESSFPSGAVFFLSAVIAYTLSSTLNFEKELEELGKKDAEWKTRLPLSIIFSCLFIALVAIYRVYYSCDSVLVVLGSIVMGGIAGFLVYLLHVYLFGRDAVNFLGLPLLADRAANGKPLYVCAKQKN
jgi:hypothetical protein